MDALNFLKFWRNPSTTNTTIPTTTIPHLVVETDTDSDEDDSFFDLELTLHHFDNKENITKKPDNDPQLKTTLEIKSHLSSKNEVNKTAKVAADNDDDSVTLSMSSNEPISKRKVLPVEPNSKPQSPISLLRSAPSFRIFTFGKQRRMASQKTEEPCGKNQKKVFAVKLNVEDFHCSPTLSRDNSTRSFASKLRNRSSEESETKPERFSKEGVQKYLKMIKPLYVKVSKRYTDKVKFSGEGFMASPSSSPSVASVYSRKEKQGSFPVGIRGVSKHLGKSRSAGTVVGVSSPANRNDDTLQQQNDGIQSAILHCKRSFNSRDSSIAISAEGSMYSMRNSFEGKL